MVRLTIWLCFADGTPFVFEIIFRIGYCIRSKCTSDKYILFKWSTRLQSMYNHMVWRKSVSWISLLFLTPWKLPSTKNWVISPWTNQGAMHFFNLDSITCWSIIQKSWNWRSCLFYTIFRLKSIPTKKYKIKKEIKICLVGLIMIESQNSAKYRTVKSEWLEVTAKSVSHKYTSFRSKIVK